MKLDILYKHEGRTIQVDVQCGSGTAIFWDKLPKWVCDDDCPGCKCVGQAKLTLKQIDAIYKDWLWMDLADFNKKYGIEDLGDFTMVFKQLAGEQ